MGEERLHTFYPGSLNELYLGFNITDRLARIKINERTILPSSIVPRHRSKPNHLYFKRIVAKFNRARHGTHQLCPNKEILTPGISTRLYKTLQRSTLLYGTELADWDVDQLLKIEKLQAKALRSLLDLDLQCPKVIIRILPGVEPFEARTDLHILLYYAKLCRSPSNSILGKIHVHRNSHRNKLPQGFHNTVWHTLTKYRLTHLWNTIPEDINLECDLKTFLKIPIWL